MPGGAAEPERARARRTCLVCGGPGRARRAAEGSALGLGVLGAAEFAEEAVALGGPLGVLLHDGAEEVGDVLLAGVLRVADVLAVVVAGLQEWYWTEMRSKTTSLKPVSPVAMGPSCLCVSVRPWAGRAVTAGCHGGIA